MVTPMVTERVSKMDDILQTYFYSSKDYEMEYIEMSANLRMVEADGEEDLELQIGRGEDIFIQF